MNFRPGTKFVYRLSRFSRQEVTKKFSDHTIEEILEMPDFVEILSHSIPDFWSQLQLARATGKLTVGLKHAVERYIIRSGTRHTPFGLMAGSGIGQIIAGAPALKNPRNFLRPVHVKLWLHENVGSELLTLNPAMQFRASGAHLYRFSKEKDKFVSRIDHVDLPIELMDLMRELPHQFNLSDIQRSFSEQLGVSEIEAQAGIRILLDHDVILRARSVSEYSSSIDGNCLKKVEGKNPPISNLIWKEKPTEAPITLDQRLAEKLLAVADLMLNIWGPIDVQRRAGRNIAALIKHLKSFHDHGPVPLLTITPKVLDVWLSETRPVNFSTLNVYFGQKLEELKNLGQYEWKLSSKDIEDLLKIVGADPNTSFYAPALTVLAQCHPEKMPVYEYFVTNSASRILGRFGLMDEGIQDWINEIQEFEKKSYAPHIVADISYRCQNDKQSIIGSRVSSFESYVDCVGQVDGKSRRIPMSDIGISIENSNEPVLVSLTTGERIITVNTNMLGSEWGNHFALKILRLLGERKIGDAGMWHWDDQALPFNQFPRVVVKGVVVRRRTWVIRDKDLSEEGLKALGLPDVVRLVEGDMKLMLNTASESFFYEIKRKLSKEKKIYLEEDFNDDDTLEVCVTGFNKNPPPLVKAYVSPITQNHCDYYFKAYVHPADYGYFMSGLAQILKEELNLAKHFSCLYFEERGCHLRMRFFNLSEKQNELVRNSFVEWLLNLQRQSILLKFESASYEPETNRWGGEEGVLHYEGLMIADTSLLLDDWNGNSGYGTESDLIANIHFWAKGIAGTMWKDLLKALIMKTDNLSSLAVANEPLQASRIIIPEDNRASLARFLNGLNPPERLMWLRDILHLSLHRRMGHTKLKEKLLLRKAYEWCRKDGGE